jgi:cytochrome P450
MANAQVSDACPLHANPDDRKSARIAEERVSPDPGAQVIGSFTLARDVLRSSVMKQGALGAEQVNTGNTAHIPVFFLDGEPHRRKRTAIARFFTPKAVATRYRAVMEQTTEELLSPLRATGQACLDEIGFELAVAVTADIVGLTNSDRAAMAKRIAATLSSGLSTARAGLRRPLMEIAKRFHALNFFYRDVRPAIDARRRERKDDVISHLVDEGYSDRAILIECMTYGSAGMVTTREFIVMAAWHLFERDALRARFLAADEDDQLAILEEILRLEPVAARVYRRATDDLTASEGGRIPAGTQVAIDIRAVNSDESVAGPCPHRLDPDRAKRSKAGRGSMSFGDGNHRCPGAQVAMQETRIFLDRLLRFPGIRLTHEPEMRWCNPLMSYELRNAIVACDRH